MIFIIPTDTCYGLAGEMEEQDYAMIYDLKGRSFKKQLAFLVRDFAMLEEYAHITPQQILFLKNYPHPWSVVLPRKQSYQLPSFLDAKQYANISFRLATQCLSVETEAHIVAQATFPLFLTSANISGQQASTSYEQVRSVFPQVTSINGGECSVLPSDIFSFSDDGSPCYIRNMHTKK